MVASVSVIVCSREANGLVVAAAMYAVDSWFSSTESARGIISVSAPSQWYRLQQSTLNVLKT